MIHKPNGIVLVTGPTGSGKTTTLYSALNELNEITDKIITTEDPVEYEIDGICQVPINSEIGVTFAAVPAEHLAAGPGQDPGRRDPRPGDGTDRRAGVADGAHGVQHAAHQRRAQQHHPAPRHGCGAVLDHGHGEGILAQRLVRKICEDCRTEFQPSQEMLMEINLRPEDAEGKKFYYGRGCQRCNNTGHRGRCGIFELVVMNDELRDLISGGVSTDELRRACRDMGMVTLREAGLKALFDGVTTIEEVARETVLEDESWSEGRKGNGRRNHEERRSKRLARARGQLLEADFVLRSGMSGSVRELLGSGRESAAAASMNFGFAASDSMRISCLDFVMSDLDSDLNWGGWRWRRSSSRRWTLPGRRSRTRSRPRMKKKPSRRSSRWATS